MLFKSLPVTFCQTALSIPCSFVRHEGAARSVVDCLSQLPIKRRETIEHVIKPSEFKPPEFAVASLSLLSALRAKTGRNPFRDKIFFNHFQHKQRKIPSYYFWTPILGHPLWSFRIGKWLFLMSQMTRQNNLRVFTCKSKHIVAQLIFPFLNIKIQVLNKCYFPGIKIHYSTRILSDIANRDDSSDT